MRGVIGLRGAGLITVSVVVAGPFTAASARATEPHPAADAKPHQAQATAPRPAGIAEPRPTHTGQLRPVRPIETRQPRPAATHPVHSTTPRPSRSADVRLVYGRAELAPGDSGVVWRWTLVNNGSVGAEDVVVEQRVDSGQRVVAAARPCGIERGMIVCRYSTLRPGERRVGWIKTARSSRTGALRVDATITWREAPLPEFSPDGERPRGLRHPGH